VRLPGTGRDLPDDRKHDRFLGRLLHVDAPHRVAVHRGLVESGQRALGDHVLGAQQTLGLGDGHPYRRRTHRSGENPFELLVYWPHRW